MTSVEIKQRIEKIDQFCDRVIDYCMAALFIVAILVASLIGYEAFNQ